MSTMKMATIGAATVFAFSIAACDGDEPMGNVEASEWMPADAGIPPRPDASYAPDPRLDASSGRVCFEASTLADAALPRCATLTRDCINGCAEGSEGDECRSVCWASDETPRYTEGGANIGCNDCIFQQLLGCLDRDGCDAEVAAFYCCVIDRCAAGGDGCLQTECGSEATAMYTCGGAAAPHCFALTVGDVGMCYAASDPSPEDAGSLDAGTDAGADERDGGAS